MVKGLPAIIEVSDYHEFSDVQNYLKIVVPNVKVKEVGCDGDYFGMAYVGKLTDKKNAEMLEKLQKRQAVEDTINEEE